MLKEFDINDLFDSYKSIEKKEECINDSVINDEVANDDSSEVIVEDNLEEPVSLLDLPDESVEDEKEVKKDETKKVVKKEVKKEVKPRELTPQESFALNYLKCELENEASKNELFSNKYKSSKKTDDDLWNYIVSCAKKLGSGFAIHHSTMLRWALDFYNDGLDASSQSYSSSNIMLESSDEDKSYDASLTEQDKILMKQKALDEFKAKELKRLEDEKISIALKEKDAQKKAIEKEQKKIAEQKAKQEELNKKKGFETLSLFDF